MMLFTGILAALSLQSSPAEQPIEAPWLHGCWQGEALGGHAVECWMHAPMGRLTGVFELHDDTGAQVFSELIVIDTFEDGPAMRLKHFRPDLTGWEAGNEYINFPLVEQREDALIFNGLEMHLLDENRVLVEVVLGEGDEPHVERFEYTRID
jgi:hypothetical protein